MSCVILLMRLGCFPSLLLKINDIRQGSSLLFFFLLSNMFDKSAKLGIRHFLFTFFDCKGPLTPRPHTMAQGVAQ